MLGDREVLVDPAAAASKMPLGTVTWQSVITTAVVDRVGRRPTP